MLAAAHITHCDPTPTIGFASTRSVEGGVLKIGFTEKVSRVEIRGVTHCCTRPSWFNRQLQRLEVFQYRSLFGLIELIGVVVSGC